MKDKRFIRRTVIVTGILCVLAVGFALVRVRAQTATIQPFVAVMVEEMSPRKDQPPTPIIRLQTVAVRSDGSISRVSRWEVRTRARFIYSREVIDATAKTHSFVEDTTQSVVSTGYSDLQAVKPRGLCEGTTTETIDGYATMYSEHPMGSPDNGDSSVVHKQWLAPKLGCYPIVQEFVGTIHGQPMDTKQTLVSIRLGEPNPWYFEVPTSYASRTTEEWMALMKPLLKQ